MADAGNLPVILIEVLLVFGGTLLFGWWQLRSVRRDRELLRKRRAVEAMNAGGDPDAIRVAVAPGADGVAAIEATAVGEAAASAHAADPARTPQPGSHGPLPAQRPR